MDVDEDEYEEEEEAPFKFVRRKFEVNFRSRSRRLS